MTPAPDSDRLQTAPAEPLERSDESPAPAHHECKQENRSLLVVDDNNMILQTLIRRLQTNYSVWGAASGEEGLAVLAQNGPFAVVISDQEMPGLSGVDFLAQVRLRAPETVRLMLTGNADLETAIAAINGGEIFRFLKKPVDGPSLDRAVAAGFDHYRLITAQRVLLSKTLHGSIKVLVDLLAMTRPELFGHATRVKDLSSRLGASLHVDPLWELEIAAMLAFIGLLALPDEMVDRMLSMQPLQGMARQMIDHYPEQSVNLLVQIPRMEAVTRIIRYHSKDYCEDDARDGTVPLASRIISVASTYCMLLSQGMEKETALAALMDSRRHDPYVVSALSALIPRKQPTQATLRFEELRPGMIMASDLRSTNDEVLLLAGGLQLSDVLLHRLSNYQRQGVLPTHMTVLIPPV
jgi:response regulator RpfG family c-di-GMP phosphodiesterase